MRKVLVEAYELRNRHGSFAAASRATGIPVTTLKDRVRVYENAGGCAAVTTVGPVALEDPGASTLSDSLNDEVKRLKKLLISKRRNEDLVLAAVKDSLADGLSISVPSGPAPGQGSGEEQFAIVVLSDTQVGKVTPTYDVATCRERVMTLARKVVKITQVRRAGAKIRHIRVYLLGDAVEGEQIYASQPFHIALGVYQQACHEGPKIHAEFILYLLQHFEEVEVVCVAGNHGRPGLKGTATHPLTNWDRVCYEVTGHLVERAAPGRIKRFEIAQDWYTVDRLPGGWGALLHHGDMILGMGSSGSFEKAARGWADAIEEPWDYCIQGHVHHLTYWPVGTRGYYTNGSTESPDSDYVKGHLKATGIPSQWLFFMNEEHGIISQEPVLLTTAVPQARRHQARAA